MSTQLQGLLKRLDEIVDGIDRDESDGGWWETEKGVELGKTTLRELRQLVTEAAQSAEARAALADEPAVPEDREPVAVAGQPSDEELALIYHDCCRGCEFMDQGGFENAARAVLARWGNPAPQPPAEGEVAELILRVQRLEAMRETEKAALLDAFKQIDDLKHRIDFHYMKIHRLEDALPGQEAE